MPDKELNCKDCGNLFILTDGEQSYFAQMGFTEPKRCKPCRQLKKAQKEANGGNYASPARPAPPSPSGGGGRRGKKRGGDDYGW